MSAPTLFSIAQTVRDLVTAADPETGEISDLYSKTLDLFKDKGAACVVYAVEEAEAISAQESMLAKASQHVAARKARLARFRAYMADAMKQTGVMKLHSFDGLFSARLELDRDVSVQLDEDAQFPPELCGAPKPPAPSKTLIKAAIERGEPVAGARLIRKDRLTII